MQTVVERGVYAASTSPARRSIVSFTSMRTVKRPEGRAPGELVRCTRRKPAMMFELDSNFSPTYIAFVKQDRLNLEKDRLNNQPSTNCQAAFASHEKNL